MFLAVILLPLISAFFVLLFGRFFNRTITATISIISLALALFLSSLLFVDYVTYGLHTNLQTRELLSVHGISLTYSLSYDYLALLLLVMVLAVSLFVNIYSIAYMWQDPHFNRFFGYLALFVFFMLLLIASTNMVQFFIAWEGVGLVSFLLVGFWFTRTQATVSALKAFIINRVGDAALLIALFSTITFFKIPNFLLFSFNDIHNSFFLIYASTNWPFYNEPINFACFFEMFLVIAITLGAMSKSAQIFLHTWLPDAMEGPTPVSALIHAATMVAAGVYLLIKASFSVFAANIFVDGLSNKLALIGAITSIFAASVGIFQYDVKKIVAYSTCSQLGYMVAAALAGLTTYSAFHLINHAFFKALLFLTSGALIHAMNDVQDIRRYGSLLSVLPFTYCMFMLGSISLVAFPFTSGFYSKDLIIEFFSSNGYSASLVVIQLLLLVSSFLTAIYSTKLLYLTFVSTTHVSLSAITNASENQLLFTFVLTTLAILSITSGAAIKDFFAPSSGYLWGLTVDVVPVSTIFQSEFILDYYVKHIVLILTLAGIWVGVLVYSSVLFPKLPLAVKKYLPALGFNNLSLKVFHFFSRKWYFDNLYNFFITENALRLSYEILTKEIELGVLEFFVISLIADLIAKLSIIFSKFATGDLRHYLNYFIFTIFFCLAIGVAGQFSKSTCEKASYFFIPLYLYLCTMVVNSAYQELYSNFGQKRLGPLYIRTRALMVAKTPLYFFLFFYGGVLQKIATTMLITYFMAVMVYYSKYSTIYPYWLFIRR